MSDSFYDLDVDNKSMALFYYSTASSVVTCVISSWYNAFSVKHREETEEA